MMVGALSSELAWERQRRQALEMQCKRLHAERRDRTTSRRVAVGSPSWKGAVPSTSAQAIGPTCVDALSHKRLLTELDVMRSELDTEACRCVETKAEGTKARLQAAEMRLAIVEQLLQRVSTTANVNASILVSELRNVERIAAKSPALGWAEGAHPWLSHTPSGPVMLSRPWLYDVSETLGDTSDDSDLGDTTSLGSPRPSRVRGSSETEVCCNEVVPRDLVLDEWRMPARLVELSPVLNSQRHSTTSGPVVLSSRGERMRLCADDDAERVRCELAVVGEELGLVVHALGKGAAAARLRYKDHETCRLTPTPSMLGGRASDTRRLDSRRRQGSAHSRAITKTIADCSHGFFRSGR